MKWLPSMLWNGAKIAACGAIIAAIAMGFVILTPQGDVDRADADIFWTGPSSLQTSKQDLFIDLLDDQGFSEPQPYDWNDNIVYFSHGQTDESPRQAAARLQEAFLREGINDNVFPVAPDPSAMADETATVDEKAYATLAAEEFFSGGMIPVVDTGDHVAFTSVEVAADGGNIDNLDELQWILAELPEHVGAPSIFNNIRYVEVFRAEGQSQTQKIAVFGDEKVNLNLFQPGTGGVGRQVDSDDRVPACIGCERNSRLSGMEDQSGFEMQSFNSPDTVDGVLAFYRRAMLTRGWEMSSSADILGMVSGLQEMTQDREGDAAIFVRGNRIVHIHAYPADRGGTHVNIFQGS